MSKKASEINLAQALDEISTALSVLTGKIRAENLAGLTSLNRLSEDLLLPVFQLVFSAPRLRNVNWELSNYPHIDLADDSVRLAIQVTSERSESKITDTVRNFIAKAYHIKFDRIIVFILSHQEPRFASKTKAKWKKLCGQKLRFNPASDIVTPQRLYPLIQSLAHEKIFRVRDIVAKSIVGKDFVDVPAILARQAERQLDYEKKSGKYVPNIFVETRETKNIARTFSHPALFFRRTVESITRLNIQSWNRFLEKAGLRPLPLPEVATALSKELLSETYSEAEGLNTELARLAEVIAAYAEGSRKGGPPLSVKPERKHFYEKNVYTLQTALGYGLKHQIEDISNALRVVSARVFILTGRAGQGKTNLICDFVENFLLKHSIPCAYLTARRLSNVQCPDLADAVQRLIFDGKTDSFAEAAGLLSEHAARINKPFVLIIDGLNEHPRIGSFADQLVDFVEAFVTRPHLKLFLACRSEFFHIRFGSLLRPPLSEYTFVIEANEYRMEQKFHDQMIDAYFEFYGVRRDRVSDGAIQSLKRDVLLLRFFCEVYGSKGKPKNYRQPSIRDIYREEIFRTYLKNKLGSADMFLSRVKNALNPATAGADLKRVLEVCVKHMIESWTFGNVPVSVVPRELEDALYALLDEELILRRDAPPDAALFAPLEEAINFTFDELRDYLLAQYLVNRVFQSDRREFEKHVSQNDPKESQTVEGLKRFLFYASRHLENEAFWQFYREQRWYMDVYDAELFNVDAKLHRKEDREIIEQALAAGGERAGKFSRSIAVRWNSHQSPLLNLDLLLSVVVSGDDDRFRKLIEEPFRSIRHFNDGSSAKAFCEFIVKHILPELKPDPAAAEHVLFKFLTLLLPVDSGPDLNSDSDAVFRMVLGAHPAYAMNLLREALTFRPTRHRAHVWRLLAVAAANLSPDDPLLTEAQHDAQEQTLSAATRREAQRFLERFGGHVSVKP